MSTTDTLTSGDRVQVASVRGGRWVVKRALFGLAMLLSVSIGAAMLLDATIDPTLEAASE